MKNTPSAPPQHSSAPHHPQRIHRTLPQAALAYTPRFFESLVDAALAEAKKLGATDAGAEVSEGCGLSVSVRNGELENVERNRDKSLGVTVYVRPAPGQRQHLRFFRTPLLRKPCSAAYDIARFTAEDPFAGLPDEADIAPVADREP